MRHPSKHPDEFRVAAVELARETGKPIAQIARELDKRDLYDPLASASQPCAAIGRNN